MALPASLARRCWPTAGRLALVADVAHHVLDPGVILESVDRQVLAVAGMLETAVRHLGYERDVRVDPDRAEVELPGGPHRPAVITGPDARGQAVLHAVGPADGLVLGAELLHGHHRPEDFLLDHLVVLAQAGDHGGGVAESPAADPVAAGPDLGVLGRPLDEASHPG